MPEIVEADPRNFHILTVARNATRERIWVDGFARSLRAHQPAGVPFGAEAQIKRGLHRAMLPKGIGRDGWQRDRSAASTSPTTFTDTSKGRSTLASPTSVIRASRTLLRRCGCIEYGRGMPGSAMRRQRRRADHYPTSRQSRRRPSSPCRAMPSRRPSQTASPRTSSPSSRVAARCSQSRETRRSSSKAKRSTVRRSGAGSASHPSSRAAFARWAAERLAPPRS